MSKYNTARKKLLSDSIVASFKLASVEGDCYSFRQYKADDEEKYKAGDKTKRRNITTG